jgi:hypothetical protein
MSGERLFHWIFQPGAGAPFRAMVIETFLHVHALRASCHLQSRS